MPVFTVAGPVAASPTIRPVPILLSRPLFHTERLRWRRRRRRRVTVALILTDKQDSVSGKPKDCQPQSPKRITSRRRKAGQCLGDCDGSGSGVEFFINVAPHALFMLQRLQSKVAGGLSSMLAPWISLFSYTYIHIVYICIYMNICAGKTACKCQQLFVKL